MFSAKAKHVLAALYLLFSLYVSRRVGRVRTQLACFLGSTLAFQLLLRATRRSFLRVSLVYSLQGANAFVGKTSGLGDIMGSTRNPAQLGEVGHKWSKLSTGSRSNHLAQLFVDVSPPFTALDRVALTANGNLQRILSAVHDDTVAVEVVYCNLLDKEASGKRGDCRWDRKVVLVLPGGRLLATATSLITVHSPACAKLIKSQEIGIGQLFRHLNSLPTFSLQDAGRTGGGGLWRRYQLGCEEMTCVITETFADDVWTRTTTSSSPRED